MAYFGKSSQPLFSDDYNICAKQSFYTKTKTVTWQDSHSVEIQQNIPYDSIKQAQDLIMEVTCFIGEWMDKCPAGKFMEIKIPEMKFVKAGLAIEQVNKGERHCFLLEFQKVKAPSENTCVIPQLFHASLLPRMTMIVLSFLHLLSMSSTSKPRSVPI